MENQETWIIYDKKTKAIQRVVECSEDMVMMTGMWSNQWAYVSWNDAIKLVEEKMK